MNKETRIFNCEVRAVMDEERGASIAGRPIVYDSPTEMGWYTEVIDTGALEGADLRDVRLLVNHNTDMIPLARSRNNNINSTMYLEKSGLGMDFVARIDIENNADARSLYSAVERGDITGMSFMFSVDQDRWEGLDSEHPIRHIVKLSKIWEISAVTFPAYEDTSIQARGLSQTLEGARESLESALLEKRKETKGKIKILLEV